MRTRRRARIEREDGTVATAQRDFDPSERDGLWQRGDPAFAA
jgi:hypothetical protein